MTIDELKSKLEPLLIEYAKSNPSSDIFISVIDIYTAIGIFMGYGCQACHAELITAELEAGHFEHNTKHHYGETHDENETIN
jgi:hypothetical protein